MSIPDKQAFHHLIQENRRIIYKICNSYCRNAQDREDLAQEIIYQLWRSGHSFNADHKFSTWMYRIALNTAISFYRKSALPSKTVPLTEHVIDMAPDTDPDTITGERIGRLQELILAMNELDRALILLYLEEKSHREISEILGISVSNVGTKIGRIKEKLKEQFSTNEKITRI
ncbi:RNA polymerase sigma factor [Chitinophaga barathri]|uniref:Sigma-70 family RNA polymerase sigma factor n=1 Tax=Chitinophaga barathri TaxID=1647451 RepID=A0A3N4M7D7_9BACT|nr:sigma-70 family RNA polymerase sigma factor [Chitinophaga barathri]RPD39168.1 sigma-70 family RNA polymerase sigma factor [Chitinophaga barathri]